MTKTICKAKMFGKPIMKDWMYQAPEWFRGMMTWMLDSDKEHLFRGLDKSEFEDIVCFECSRRAMHHGIPLHNIKRLKSHSMAIRLSIYNYFICLLEKWGADQGRQELIRALAVALCLLENEESVVWIDTLESWLCEAMGLKIPEWEHSHFERPSWRTANTT